MSVWYCIPSARPPEESEKILKLWRERGYSIGLWRDHFTVSTYAYPGYAAAVNALIRSIINGVPDAEWFVTGGDDVEPDLNHTAEEIAQQCAWYFLRKTKLEHMNQLIVEEEWATFGVMQPTGDRWGDRQGPYIDRVCGSPWMGREFCRRMYGGRGPLFEGYYHMGEDEELQAVATKLGVLWQRPDLIHFHRHWGRTDNPSRNDIPKFLERANSPEEWAAYKNLFAERQAAGFPGHEPIL